MYFDSRMNDKIPIFPLPLVLLPVEKLPLHIFEEKYRKMIEHCLKNNQKFGIVNSKNKDLLTIGCTASIEQLIGSDQYDNGEYDILVTGVDRFIVKSYNDSEMYKQAHVKTWKDLDESINNTLLKETNVLLYEVLMKLGASSKISQINMPKNSFEISSMLIFEYLDKFSLIFVLFKDFLTFLSLHLNLPFSVLRSFTL